MKMVELKATLESGTRVSVTALDNPIITLHMSSGDQREPDHTIWFSVEEWNEVQFAVQKLMNMVIVDKKPPPPMPVKPK